MRGVRRTHPPHIFLPAAARGGELAPVWVYSLGMTERLTTQSRRFDCERCGAVTFRVEETETTDEIGEHVSTRTDRVKGFGTCAVFKESGQATAAVLEKCPVYAKHFAALPLT